MKTGRAFVGGVIGALTISAVTGILRLVGVAIHLELLLGSMLLGAVGPPVWVLGLVMHLLAGGICGVAYAAIFERGLHDANAGLGVALGAVHAVIAGVLLAYLPEVHPLIPAFMPAPGLFLLGLGAFGVLLFIGLHLMFGAIVGTYYGPTAAERRAPLLRGRVSTRP